MANTTYLTLDKKGGRRRRCAQKCGEALGVRTGTSCCSSGRPPVAELVSPAALVPKGSSWFTTRRCKRGCGSSRRVKPKPGARRGTVAELSAQVHTVLPVEAGSRLAVAGRGELRKKS